MSRYNRDEDFENYGSEFATDLRSNRSPKRGRLEGVTRLHRRNGNIPAHNFTGVGPKNYVRSDQRLRDDICDELSYSPDIDAREIDVEVNQGVITLKGNVPDKWMKYEAEDIAEHITGVKEIKNDLKVT